MILLSLLEKNQQHSSVLYEISYFKLNSNQGTMADFFEYYYKAYHISPNSPRSLPGRAFILSATGDGCPTLGNFPWLSAAMHYYDNPRIWTNAVLTLKSHGLLENTDLVQKLAKALPEHLRPVFHFYRFQLLEHKEDAKHAIISLRSWPKDDFRFDIFRRRLLLELGERERAVENLGRASQDPFKNVLLWDFWVSYYLSEHIEQKGLDAAMNFITAVSDYVRPVIQSEQKQKQIRNSFVRSLAIEQIKKRDYAGALALLGTQESVLSASNYELAAALCFQLDQPQEAIEWLKKQLLRSTPQNRDKSVRMIIDYSSVLGDPNTVIEYIRYAKEQGMTGVMTDYGNLLGNAQQTILHKWIRKVLGDLEISTAPSWQLRPLDACARVSATSIANFYGKGLTREQVSNDIDNYMADAGNPSAALANFFTSKGLQVVYFVPVKEVARELLSNDCPLLLVHNRLVQGLTIGHISIIRGFDDLISKFFLGDVSLPGESRIKYADMIDSTTLMLVAPSDKIDNLVADNLSKYVVPPPWKLLTSEESARLTALGAEPKYWSLRHNGRLLKGKDNRKALKHYEEALTLRKPSDVAFYYSVVETFVRMEDVEKQEARGYIVQGLKIQPRDILLLEYYIKTTANTALKKRKLSQNLTTKLLSLTETMEAVNSNYAPTYLLRADILFLGSLWQYALTAYQKYLEKYETMSSEWKNRNEQSRIRAQKTVDVCREKLSVQVRENEARQ